MAEDNGKDKTNVSTLPPPTPFLGGARTYETRGQMEEELEQASFEDAFPDIEAFAEAAADAVRELIITYYDRQDGKDEFGFRTKRELAGLRTPSGSLVDVKLDLNVSVTPFKIRRNG